jgi:hypothetical protein
VQLHLIYSSLGISTRQFYSTAQQSKDHEVLETIHFTAKSFLLDIIIQSKNSLFFMGSEGLLSCSCEPATSSAN